MASQTRRHFADPHHPLEKTQYSHDQIGHCNLCLLKLAGLTGYGCYHCNIHVHGECARHFAETISFFAHPHTLKLTRIPELRTCDICRGHCPPGSFAYRCGIGGCGFYAHSLCAMLPQRVGNLRMVSSSEAGCCSECRHPLPVWRYVCSSPDLQLHVTCAIAIDPPTGAGKGSRNGPAGIQGNHHGAGCRQRNIGGGPAGQGWHWPPPPPIPGSYFGGPVLFQGGYWPAPPPPFQGSYFGAGVPFIQGGYGWLPPPFLGSASYYTPAAPGGHGAAGGHNIFGDSSGMMTGIASFLANVAINTVAGDFASQLLGAVLGC
ncbi:unnamed protein product [Urochloa decumbens]|uniref:Phorbol-ester/DAG-type domain-containing protein n=1 Tax=Urochloa decumbens TaxID=240449 RepID=A0ABC9FXW1_9POAL